MGKETGLWNHNRLSRRRLLTLGGAFLAGQVMGFGKVFARPAVEDAIRVGIVTPTKTGEKPVNVSVYDLIGEAARKGALLAKDDVGARADAVGMRLDLLRASSPSADAAYRAGQRLVATEDLCAIVGGLGDGQAEALSEVASGNKIPFFNIGSTSDALRGEACSPYTFHVEASAAMYLDALVAWYARANHRRWFIVYEDPDVGLALRRRALKAVAQHSSGEVVGTAAVEPGQPMYITELDRIRRSDADVVLLLLGPRDQLAFLVRAESAGIDVAVAPFPHPVTQTRDYLGAVHYRSPRLGSGYRVALWETTLEPHGARGLNDRFISRWGAPMDPPAWASYQSIEILFETIRAIGSLEASSIVDYLRSSQAVFDANKGMKVSFRPWDHQLRQPLYIIKIDPEAEWGRQVSKRVEIADLVAELPSSSSGEENTIERLDQLGDGPEASHGRC